MAIAIFGFPVAIGLAWAFDITPEGVRRAAPAPPRVAQRAPRAVAYAGVGVLVALVGLGAYAYLGPDGGASRGDPAGDRGSHAIAVLPFQNFSADAENDDSAVVTARRAVGLDPDLSDTHTALGTALAAAGRFRESVPAFERALEPNPNDWVAMGNLGVTFGVRGQLDSAPLTPPCGANPRGRSSPSPTWGVVSGTRAHGPRRRCAGAGEVPRCRGSGGPRDHGLAAPHAGGCTGGGGVSGAPRRRRGR